MASHELETATLAGGCFWCLEAVYQEVPGIREVVSGYAGGHRENPSYEQVCTGVTGHAEVVQLRFDPAAVPYRRLLEIFFTIHDPTQLDRQGADVGSQYRSGVFYHSPEQRATAEALVRELEEAGVFDSPIVTRLEPIGPGAATFYPAEEYHQSYYRNHPEQGYCRAVINPKLAKFRARYTAPPPGA
ncbi:MAG TPA: peptide-methionine (S)-S-oxide reductase MsrA [Thermoanaerobaculia bacterium]|nr:peptide-methionine (S)-S-oxide reductase MsrA [Thermoanaerobaculia bacterium]